jgi:hypothetical protein
MSFPFGGILLLARQCRGSACVLSPNVGDHPLLINVGEVHAVSSGSLIALLCLMEEDFQYIKICV